MTVWLYFLFLTVHGRHGLTDRLDLLPCVVLVDQILDLLYRLIGGGYIPPGIRR